MFIQVTRRRRPRRILLAAVAVVLFIAVPRRFCFKGNDPSTKPWNPLEIPKILDRIDKCNSVGLSDALVAQLFHSAFETPPPPSLLSSPITSLIHQSWKSKEVPSDFKKWSKSWHDQNPDWEYRLWTDDDNRDLVKNHYPWFLPVYDGMPRHIMRVDSVRNLYMHRYGGVYADLDTWCLRSMSNLTKHWSAKGQAMVGMMSGDTAFPHNIPNAWMASAPGHPFWLFAVGVIAHRVKEEMKAWEVKRDEAVRNNITFNEEVKAEESTGPVLLKHVHDTWKCTLGEEARVVTLPAGK